MESLLNPEFVYIDSDEALHGLCVALQAVPVVGFDSEFMRTNTFFPIPGLFQVHDGRQAFIIDPLGISEWQAFKALLVSPTSQLVMHSCSEDLSLLQSFLDLVPALLFDTQLAAAFTDHGYSISYQELVRVELGIEIPKGETRSDWLRRPLSVSQLHYAALDVVHLDELKARLTHRLEELGRLEWFESDCAALLTQARMDSGEAAWESAYKSLGAAWQLDEQALGSLQQLCYWREQTARRRDKPRNWILKDQDLIGLATRLPAEGVTARDVEKAAVLPERVAQREGGAIARCLNEPLAFAEPAHPGLMPRPLTGSGRKLLKRLQGLTRDLAEDMSLSPEVLARKRLWLQLLANYYAGQEDIWPPGLGSWRKGLLQSGVEAILADDRAVS